jgi:soluble lytic murein transglycosylase-like protein
MADVKAALNTAAARTYWPNSAPTIKVPLKLVYAVAWQESGWQSTIIACDGGVGTMQVMRPTAEWMNTRFETSWNIDTLSGNTYLGAQFLAWLIKYMGDLYFAENYDFYDPATGEVTNENLLNAVIAAYNVGHGKVDPTKATPYPNPRYVQNVRALMVSCPCTAG